MTEDGKDPKTDLSKAISEMNKPIDEHPVEPAAKEAADGIKVNEVTIHDGGRYKLKDRSDRAGVKLAFEKFRHVKTIIIQKVPGHNNTIQVGIEYYDQPVD